MEIFFVVLAAIIPPVVLYWWLGQHHTADRVYWFMVWIKYGMIAFLFATIPVVPIMFISDFPIENRELYLVSLWAHNVILGHAISAMILSYKMMQDGLKVSHLFKISILVTAVLIGTTVTFLVGV